jgi:phage terminase Nu1 subunit (DNA packaging protein)
MTKKTKPKRAATAAEVCDELEVSRATLSSYVKRGCPCTKRGAGKATLFDVGELVLWRQAEGLDGTVGRKAEPPDDALTAARLEKEQAMARNWQLRNEQILKEYVLSADVSSHMVMLANEIKNVFGELPAAISTVPGIGADNATRDAIHRAVRHRVDTAINLIGENMTAYYEGKK